MVSCSGSLVQACCGEGGALQTDVTGHWACPRSGVCAFPSTLLRLQAAPQERALRCVHLPGLSRSGSGSRVPHQGADSVGPAFCAFPVRAAQAAGPCPAHSLQGQRDFFPPRQPQLPRRSGAPCVSPGELISGCDPPGGMSAIQNLRKSLVRNGSLCAVW